MTNATLTAPTGTSSWALDAAHARAEFAVRHLMISTVKGHFSDVQGHLHLPADDVSEARLDVEIDAASIDTGVGKRDEHLRSADFFEVERFPKLTFTSTKVERTGDDTLQVTGALTIRDVTREVVLEVTEHGTVADPWGGRRAGYHATTKVDRKDFGLTWNQALETGGVLVGDEVKISLDAEFILDSE